MKINLQKQNFEYLIGIILVIAMGLFPTLASKIAYFHFFLVLLFFMFSIRTEQLNKSVYEQLLLFGMMIIIALLGCMEEMISYSVRNVGALICLAFFIAWYANRDSQSLSSRGIFVLFTIYLLILSVLFQFYSPREEHTGNLLAGLICFISCCGTFLYLQLEKRKISITWLTIYVFLTLYVLFMTQGRTGLATYIFIWIFYLGSVVIKNKKLYKHFFWLFVLMLVCLIVMYIYLPEFSWYRSVNKYSVALFDKNLNSSRGSLWMNELQRLSDFNWLTGLGTGTLPSMERYANSSTHSSYIQMLVQNGMIGLSILLFLLYSFWRKIASFLEDRSMRFATSVLLGIMLYNCFEVTLLQNKISVGITEWFFLCLAISRAKDLMRLKRRKLL